MEDWERVKVGGRLYARPKPAHSVRGILTLFKGKRQRDTEMRRNVDKLCDLFNACLGCLVLYREEREQLRSLRNKPTQGPLSSFYGIYHLLRLLVVVPDLLAEDKTLGEESVREVIELTSDVASFLSSECAPLFAGASVIDQSSLA